MCNAPKNMEGGRDIMMQYVIGWIGASLVIMAGTRQCGKMAGTRHSTGRQPGWADD